MSKKDQPTVPEQTPEEEFRSIIKTRAQMRAEALALKNQKRVKEGPNKDVVIDLNEIDDKNKRLKASASENREGRINILNRFLANRLGMSMQVSVDLPEAQKTEEQTRVEELPPVLQNKPEEHPFVTGIQESLPTQPQPTASSSSAAKPKSPGLKEPAKADTAAKPKSPANQRTPTAPKPDEAHRNSLTKLQSPKFEDPEEEQMFNAFLAKQEQIEAIVQKEGAKRRTSNVPEFIIDKVETTHNLRSKHNKFVKTRDACDFNIEHFQLMAAKVRRTPLYQEEDFKELFELVLEAMRVFYKAKTEEELSKRRIIVKAPNEDNQKYRFRMPVLLELFDTMRQLDEDLEAVEQNRKIDFRRIKNDLKYELKETEDKDFVLQNDSGFDNEIERRYKEFMTQNLGGFFDSCARLGNSAKRILQMSENIALMEENNEINKKMLFEREYEALRPIVEANGIELFKELIEAYPGHLEEDKND